MEKEKKQEDLRRRNRWGELKGSTGGEGPRETAGWMVIGGVGMMPSIRGIGIALLQEECIRRGLSLALCLARCFFWLYSLVLGGFDDVI